MRWFKQRLGEPSTWAGLALVANALANWLAGDKSAAVQGVFGGIAMAMKEKA